MKIDGLIQLHAVFHDHICLNLDEALVKFTGECMVIKLLELTCLVFF